MNLLRTAMLMSATSALSLMAVGQASASTLTVSSVGVVYPSPSPVTASIHLVSPSISYSSVYVSPQYLNGTLDNKAVQLFGYCVDILHESGPGTFNVVSLLDYLGGNTAKYNQFAALIAAAGGPANKDADAATQAAVWDLMYDNGPYDVASGNFWINNVQNDPSLISSANSLLAQAVTNAGAAGSDLQLFVAENSSRQDMLFWTTSAVPEPASWAMMLVGFGIMGAAMRSRRKQEMKFSLA
ncbi:MAG TPA: PEPxxWA-CTERM sorting domain-containing protein [Sphingomicrobium sp.]|nr:PEPxxWA-CTERM sorting domain-containing protein [Sphingomicrobium sp.]